MFWRQPFKYFLFGFVFSIGCSQVKFQTTPSADCSAVNSTFGQGSCITKNDHSQDFDYTVSVGNVDMLFVDDNSGSMYTEQSKMAAQFPGFLDAISDLSYRIGIITTDITGSGPGHAGQFLEFAPGQTVLQNDSRVKDATHYDNITKFQKTIKRSETLLCPNNPGCPSGDERGIYALNEALDHAGSTNFFRPSGHLAIVILSDEDERSTGGGAPGSGVNGGAIPGYPAESYDLPSTFVAKTKQVLGSTKTISVHSIIIRPAHDGQAADTTCWAQQNNQGPGIAGYYGTQYAALSLPASSLQSLGHIMTGTLGNICSSNYTNEMGSIAQYLKQEDIQLPCTPDPSTLQVSFSPTPSQQIYYNVDSDNRLQFSPGVAAGTQVHLSFSCPID